MDTHIAKGKGFGGVLRYLSEGRRDQPSDKQSEILGSKGVNTNSAAELIADFEVGRNVNPRVNYAVWHTSLSFNPDDEARLTNTQMLAIAEGYLKKMGLANTQYLIVRHHDRPDNQHLHLVANLVDNQGKSIKTGRDFYHSSVAVKSLVEEHGLTPPGAPRPALQHPERFRKTDFARYEMLALANPAVLQHTERRQLLATLKQDGIGATVHVNKEGKEIGISFTKDGCTIKGSRLGPHLSLAEIDKQLAANELKQRAETHAPAVAAARSPQPLEGLVSAVEAPPSSAVTVKSAETDKAPTQPVPVGIGALDSTSEALSSAAAEVKSTVTGRELSAEPNDVQSGKVQKMESGLDDEKSTAALPIPAAQAALPSAVELAITREAAAPLPVRPRQDAAEPVTGKATPLQTPVGADMSLSAASTELPVPRTVGPNERMSSADSLAAAEAADQFNPGTPTVPVALPAMSLAEMLVSGVPDLPFAPAVAAPAVAAPAVAWQYGTISLMNSKEGTSEEQINAVRAKLLKAGVEVNKIEALIPGQLGSMVLPYRFNPNMPSLEKITAVLDAVQASDNSTVREQVHSWNPSSKHSSADRADWPVREGQFNHARILIQDTETGVARAERVAANLRDAGAYVSKPTRTEDGQVTMRVCYHTYVPAIDSINSTLDRCKNSPNIEVQESTRQNTARYAGADGVEIRRKELEKNSGISR